ncbi:MAG: penicillin-insensitive murein endopeptidase [Candidatus Rokuibacteriota bacterium]
MRIALATLLLALVVAAPSAGFVDPGAGEPVAWEPATPEAQVVWHRSAAVGEPSAGRLVRGVRFPREGEDFFTWDPVLHRIPNRASRRWATDRLVRFVGRVVREFSAAHPEASRVGIGDLSRRRGGPFGPVHVTHQNGLDADVYYPRLDRRERPPKLVSQIDRRLARELVDRFVRAGAKLIYVGPNTGFTGPRGVVQVLWNHDNHLHVRIRGTTD